MKVSTTCMTLLQMACRIKTQLFADILKFGYLFQTIFSTDRSDLHSRPSEVPRKAFQKYPYTVSHYGILIIVATHQLFVYILKQFAFLYKELTFFQLVRRRNYDVEKNCLFG